MVFMVLYTAYIMYGFPFRSSSQFFNKNNKHETERKVNGSVYVFRLNLN